MRLIGIMVAASAGLMILNGCAHYKFSGKTTSFAVDKISPNIITVTFCGNAYMSQKEVEKYALQRASVEALSKGCPYFVVVKKEDNSKICALSSGIHRDDSHESPPLKYSGYLPSTEFVEPNVTLTIQCIFQGEEVPENAINAEQFLSENFPGMQN